MRSFPSGVFSGHIPLYDYIVMWKFLTVIIIVALVGLYFWYVRGVEVEPLLKKAKSIRIRIAFEEEALPPPQDERLGTWESLPDMPTERTEVEVAALGKDIYVIGGIDGFGRTVNKVEAFDTLKRVWSEAVPLPSGKHHAAAVALGDKLYVLGGYAGLNFEPTDDLWIFDKGKERWRELKSMPEPLGAMAAIGMEAYTADKTTVRQETSTDVGAGVEQKLGPEGDAIYVFGGTGEEGLSDKVYMYDVRRNEWEMKTRMPTAREHLAAATIGDRIFVVGGRKKSITKNLGNLEVYTPAKDIWVIGPPMPTKRGGIAAATTGGRLYVFGGEDPTKTFDAVEEYDPAEKKWRKMNPMSRGRHGLGAAEVDEKIYVIGGGKRPLLSVSGLNEVFTSPDNQKK